MTTSQRLKERNARGQCGYCHRPLQPGSKSRCVYHLTKQRALVRKKAGYSPGWRTGRGRPAITRLPLPSELTQQAA